MNNTCSCPFADMNTSDLKGLEKDNLVTQCIEWINALSKNISNEALIIEIANYLPAYKECAEIIGLENETDKIKESFNKAFSSIRFAIDHIINNGLYYDSEETIKAISIAMSRHTREGEDYWKKKLLNNLKEDQDLKFLKVWLSKQGNINLVIKTFDFQEEGFDMLLNEALNDGFLDNINNWSNNKSEIVNLIQLFSLPREAVFKHLEDMIQKRVLLFSEINKMSDEEILEMTGNTNEYFLSECFDIEQRYEIFIQKELYRKLADQFIIKANESHNISVRATLTNMAVRVYARIIDRKKIWNIWTSDQTNKTIRVASKIVGYKYNNQGIKDTWLIRYFY